MPYISFALQNFSTEKLIKWKTFYECKRHIAAIKNFFFSRYLCTTFIFNTALFSNFRILICIFFCGMCINLAKLMEIFSVTRMLALHILTPVNNSRRCYGYEVVPPFTSSCLLWWFCVLASERNQETTTSFANHDEKVAYSVFSLKNEYMLYGILCTFAD